VTPIAVSGLGVVAPQANDADAFFDALMRAESAVSEVELPPAKPLAAACIDLDPSPWFTKLQLAGVDRVSQFAVAAAQLALDHAGARGAVDPVRMGVYVGCGMGGAGSLEAAYRAPGRVSPLTIPAFMPNAPAAHVAMRVGVKGPVLSYAVACASSAVAIAEAAKAVACGEVDLALAGGAEAVIVPGVVVAWQAMQTLASYGAGEAATACRPFSTDRSGFVLGEGAAFLVIERAEQVRARGGQVHALVAGWGSSCDASHLTKPDAGGQRRAITAALAMAGLAPTDVGYCNAHGTATKVGDVVEYEALSGVWGPHIDRLRVSSTKALHGHLLGGAGALEAVVSVQALAQGRLPPNAHCEQPDPACPFNLVLEPGCHVEGLEAVMSNSFAFGGSNSSLVFRRA
jgi:3-oxoacyl-[acyl-carrier-protein] synthase II